MWGREWARLLDPSPRAVLRFILGGQDEVRGEEPGQAPDSCRIPSHCGSLPPTLADCQPPEMVRSLDLNHCLTRVPWDLTGLFPGSRFWPGSFFLPSTRSGPTGRGAWGLCGLPCPSADPSSPDELTCSARLTVRPSLAPLFTWLLEDVEVLEGRAARFDCKISGSPSPSVTWTQFGMALRPADVGGPPGPEGRAPG